MKKNLLLTPGPTQIPANVLEVLARPIIHHRTPQFQGNIKEAIEGLRHVYQTKNEIYLLAGSGTAAMEAAVVNLLSPGDKAIVGESGKFGERWTELCTAHGAEAITISAKWGKTVEPNQIKELLDKNPDVKAVFVTLSETSTGVMTDVKSIGAIVSKTNAVLVVDAVSGLGIVDCQTDNWNCDVVCSASHKGFMLPPGLAFVSVSEKAYKLIESCKNHRYYFDLRKSKKAFAGTDTPWTPAISLIIGLCESLKMYKKVGLENLFIRYGWLAKGVREAMKALGLTLLADEACISNVLTAVNVPLGIDGEKLVKTMRDVYGVTVAGGQDELKGKIFRISHMGCLTEDDMIAGITCLETVLKEMGYSFTPGAGVTAAQKFYNSNKLKQAELAR